MRRQYAIDKHPTVDDARSLGKIYDLERVVILWQKGARTGYASYGQTCALCDGTRRIADAMLGPWGVGIVEEEDR